MTREARTMAGIILLTVPTIQYGGYFLLTSLVNRSSHYMGRRSCSGNCVTSLPRTVIRPESGANSPSVSFKMVLLPEPATPKRALVSPKGS